jgi:DNA-binding NtrC family response regulator
MLEAAARRMSRALPRVTDAAWGALSRHSWPGNVRELGNFMERLVIYHAGREVDAVDLDLPPALGPETPDRIESRRSVPPPKDGGKTGDPIILDLPDKGTTFDDLEREILAQVLARQGGNQSKAARSLGLSESTLRSRLKRLGLKG